MSQSKTQDYKSAKEADGLEVGATVENFTAQGTKGTFKLSEELKKGPIVLIFYRGQWCPICNRHLSELQDSLKVIEAKGAQVIAVSPEKPEYLEKTKLKTNADFNLLFDENYTIANTFGVLFRPDSMSRVMYNTMLGAKLKEAHSDDSQQLPIPATYIIDKHGKVVWRHFDPNFKKRSTVKEILDNLPNG
jgi:peroxiredoxin